METGFSHSVNFLISGPAHLPYLVVALDSLRLHYRGPVVVYAYPESIATVTRIAADSSLSIRPVLWDPPYRGKNGQFINKTLMMQQIPEDIGIYLDADVLVNGCIDFIFETAALHGFVATQFCDWTMQTRTIQTRVKRLLSRTGVDQEAVEFVLRSFLPSVNGGVFACKKDSPVLKQWYDSSLAVNDIFICDETVLHTFQHPKYRAAVIGGGRWNCSPRYQPKRLADCDVRIWHGHGDSFVRPSKSQKGYDLWWPEYQRCLRDNVGKIVEWNKAAVEQNRFLKELLK